MALAASPTPSQLTRHDPAASHPLTLPDRPRTRHRPSTADNALLPKRRRPAPSKPSPPFSPIAINHSRSRSPSPIRAPAPSSASASASASEYASESASASAPRLDLLRQQTRHRRHHPRAAPRNLSDAHDQHHPRHVRAHTVDNGAPRPKRSVTLRDFKLGNVLGAGGTATVLRAELHKPPNRSPPVAADRTRPSVSAGTLPRVSSLNNVPNHQLYKHSLQPPRFASNASEFALKVVQKKALTRRAQHYLTREIAIHRSVQRHDNIVALHDVFEDTAAIYMVQELLCGGDLYTVLKRQRHGVSESVALAIIAQILQALAYMHARGFSHRDIKPENVMFAEKPCLTRGFVGTVKLIDFGLACARDPAAPVRERLSAEKCGTVRYAAPEIVTESSYIPDLADVWSVGVVLYSAIAHCNPYTGKTEKDVLEHIERGQLSFDGQEWAEVSEGTKRLIAYMLRRKPTERPSAEEALGIVEDMLCALEGQRTNADAVEGEADKCTDEDNKKDEDNKEGWQAPNVLDGLRALFSGGGN